MFGVLVGSGCGLHNAGECCHEWDWGPCGVVPNGDFGLNVVVFCDAGGCFLGEQHAGGCGVNENGRF